MARRDPLSDPRDAISRLYAYVAYRIGDGPEAEDVVSETIERALRYRDAYKPSLGSPTGWMIGIANRCIADELRGRSRQQPLDVDALEAWAEDDGDRVAMRADLARALAALDDRSRELLALRYGADLGSKEIGRILYIKSGTVDVAIHRALAQLRELMQDDAEGAASGA